MMQDTIVLRISSRCKKGAHVGTQGHLIGARSHSGRHVCTGYVSIGECECKCHDA